MDNEFRRLPGVETVLSDERIKNYGNVYPHDLLVNIIRCRLEEAQQTIKSGGKAPSINDFVESITKRVDALGNPGLRPVINATGVILHTNLGRAPFSRETIDSMEAASQGYCNLEFDMETGSRGSRQAHIEPLLCQITGAEAAFVVNNNASAVLLGLTALAKRKEVIVSRGQAVEIGGGFRVPDVMRQSGAKLVEVGTTNCTYIGDYEQAISLHSAALLHVHSSNFKVVGFTSETFIEDIAVLAKKHNLISLDDIGSGCLVDTTAFGLAPEPMVQKSVAAGTDLVFFSGDKLLGGPQAGIIVGSKILVEKLKKHPLARAVRIDKSRLAGLSATLIHYLKGETFLKIPIWRMISAPLSEIEQRANMWANVIGNGAKVIDDVSMVGGGSLPGGVLPTKVVAVGEENRKKDTGLAQEMAITLRKQRIPVVGRISGNMLLLDPRSVLPEEDEILLKILRQLNINK